VDSEQRPPPIPWQGLLALAAAVAGAFFYFDALKTARPGERAGVSFPVNKMADVDARLWQDPLEAAHKHQGNLKGLATDSPEKTREDAFHSPESLVKEIAAARIRGTLRVIPVIIPSGSYAEYAETRLRARRAVLEALGTNGFSPGDGEHIGYAQMPSPESFSGEATWLMPFEWCYKNGEAIVVLWIRDDVLEGRPLAHLADVLTQVDIGPETQALVKLIGPRGSQSLRAMVEEASKDRFSPPLALSKVTMFAATPTASERQLISGFKGTTAKEILERNVPGLKFHRTTTTDDAICDVLVKELELRGITLADPKTHVALISEWDTFYGRAFPLAFAKKATDKEGYPPNIHPFHYLRGIDGMLPGAGTGETSSKRSQTEEKRRGPDEPTEGLDQADYLRRLAQQLKGSHEALRSKGHHGIKAVGVLGSDVYDKLLLLKALRRELPGAVFFTNNLDARFGHPDEWPWARNLIVASPFGLRLSNAWPEADSRFDLQGKILPFRDSYQTAVYLAALMASSDKVEAAITGAKAPLGQPRIFEIGRSGPYELDRPGECKAEASVHPVPSDPWWNASRICLAIGIAVFALLLWAWTRFVLTARPSQTKMIGLEKETGELCDPDQLCSPEERIEKGNRVSACPFFVCAPLAAWLFVELVAHFQRGGREPFVWFEGISIWPTEVIRLIAIFLSMIFVWKTDRALAISNENVHDDFGLQQPGPKKAGPRFWQDLVRRLTLRYWLVQHCKTREIDAQALWEEYLLSGELRRRWLRIVPLIVLYLLAASCLVVALGAPTVPFRGDYSQVCDVMTLVVAVIASTAITFYVADATFLNRRLIHYLTVSDTRWPEETYQKLRTRRRFHVGGCGEDKPPATVLCDYLETELIATRTQVVGNLIYYPFIVLFLMVISRSSIFDRWDWPVSLILVLLFNATYAAWSAFSLRHSAEAARQKTLDRLDGLLIGHMAAEKPDKSAIDVIREIASAIRGENRGAFASISHHPIFGAILLPSGGLGIWALTQYLPQFFK
jgi:hypothetical protein